MSAPHTIRSLDPSTWDAIARLVEANNGVYGGCWCTSFHAADGWHASDAASNRQRKLERVCAGTAHAALVFRGQDCVGWCQFGSPDELPRIKNRSVYDGDLVELPDWRIGCCFVGKGHRRNGVATAALSGALDLIATLGGGRVEGYPEPLGAVPTSFMFNGPLSTYERAGFVKQRKIGKHRWVVSIDVSPRGHVSRQLVHDRPARGGPRRCAGSTSRPSTAGQEAVPCSTGRYPLRSAATVRQVIQSELARWRTTRSSSSTMQPRSPGEEPSGHDDA